jgi:hypothetical protein
LLLVESVATKAPHHPFVKPVCKEGFVHAFVLQDWTTIRGSGDGSVIQGSDQWPDMTAYQDLQFWLDVREVTLTSGSLVIDFETAPTKDEVLFQAMINSTNLVAAAGPIVPPIQALLSNATVPIARWLRWKITASGGASTWDATFRIVCSANSPGT